MWPLNAVGLSLSCELPSNQQIAYCGECLPVHYPQDILFWMLLDFTWTSCKFVLLSLAAIGSYINNSQGFTLCLLCMCND